MSQNANPMYEIRGAIARECALHARKRVYTHVRARKLDLPHPHYARVETVQLYTVSRFGSGLMTEFFGFPSKSSNRKAKRRRGESR